MDCLPHYTKTQNSGNGATRHQGLSAPGPDSVRQVDGPESRSKTLSGPVPGLEIPVSAWGYAQADGEEFVELRKRLPTWAPEATPANFFRYSDEQTILGAWAIDDAMRRSGLRIEQMADWGIIAAPEFLGRTQSVGFLERFHRNGAPRVSPNSIIQHSLHSVSGALSILLATRGPNVGTGGGQAAFADGLLAALTLFDLQTAGGCWLVATTWDPPPLPDAEGECPAAARCHAVALALQTKNDRASGTLTLRGDQSEHAMGGSPLSVTGLINALMRSDVRANSHQTSQQLAWQLPWGATLGLELKRPAIGLRRAA